MGRDRLDYKQEIQELIEQVIALKAQMKDAENKAFKHALNLAKKLIKDDSGLGGYRGLVDDIDDIERKGYLRD